MTQIGFLGLGAMGQRMAAKLARAGHTVTVWNRTAGPAEALVADGATVASSPAAAAEGAEVVIAMVRDTNASRAVWLGASGALGAMQPGALAIECSTLTPAWTQELATAAEARGASLLEAPLAGSRPQAEAGQLIFFLGGTAADAARAEPLLAALGAAQHPVGPVGAAAITKLAVNALFAVQVAAAAELLGLVQRSTADPARVIEVLTATPVVSPAAKVALTMMQAGAFAPLFPIDLVEKDLGYAEAAGADAAAALPLTTAARAAFSAAIARGYAGDHITGIAKLYGPAGQQSKR